MARLGTRFLPHREVPGFVAQLRAGRVTMTRLALEWLILTATRSGETRLARWSEIDEKAAAWRVLHLHKRPICEE